MSAEKKTEYRKVRLDIALRAIEVVLQGGFNKVTVDGASDIYPSVPLTEQLGTQQTLEFVHAAHSVGLTTYISAGFKNDNLPAAIYTGVDGIGIGGAQILRYMDNETGAQGGYVRMSTLDCYLGLTGFLFSLRRIFLGFSKLGMRLPRIIAVAQPIFWLDLIRCGTRARSRNQRKSFVQSCIRSSMLLWKIYNSRQTLNNPGPEFTRRFLRLSSRRLRQGCAWHWTMTASSLGLGVQRGLWKLVWSPLSFAPHSVVLQRATERWSKRSLPNGWKP